jgi:hypothetical protein
VSRRALISKAISENATWCARRHAYWLSGRGLSEGRRAPCIARLQVRRSRAYRRPIERDQCEATDRSAGTVRVASRMRPDGPERVRASLARIDAALLSVTDGVRCPSKVLRRKLLGQSGQQIAISFTRSAIDLQCVNCLAWPASAAEAINLLQAGAVHKSEIRPLRGMRD